MSHEFQEAGWATEGWAKPQAGKLVVFFKKIVRENKFKSIEAGRPVFEERIHIVKVPADQYLRIERPVREDEKIEYAVEWARFLQTGESRAIGIPVESWHQISEIQKAEFRAIGIHTVEQFSDLPDSYAGRIMGFHDLREKAKRYVNAGRESEIIAQLKMESNEKVNALEAKIAELTKLVESAMESKAPARKAG